MILSFADSVYDKAWYLISVSSISLGVLGGKGVKSATLSSSRSRRHSTGQALSGRMRAQAAPKETMP